MINKLIEQKIKELNLEENKDSYTARHITRKLMFDLKYKNILINFLKKNSNNFINISNGDVYLLQVKHQLLIIIRMNKQLIHQK